MLNSADQRSGEFKLSVPISESQMTTMMSRAGLRRSVQIGRGSNTRSAYMVTNTRGRLSLGNAQLIVEFE